MLSSFRNNHRINRGIVGAFFACLCLLIAIVASVTGQFLRSNVKQNNLEAASELTAPMLPVPKLAMPTQRVAPHGLNLPTHQIPPGKWTWKNAFPNLELDGPITLAMPDDGKNEFYLMEHAGRIISFLNDPDVTTSHVLLDLTHRFKKGWNVGPHGLTFHPEFGNSESPHQGLMYVYYKNTESHSVLARYHIPTGSQTADPNSETILISQHTEKVHDGGAICFGPDGFLYVAVGDGQDKTNHQTISRNLFSGLLRIDVEMQGGDISHPPIRKPQDAIAANYFIPNDNPFVGTPDILEEFFALGLRNPHRISIDQQTGDVWVGDVGADKWEEVNLVKAGANMQWPYVVGNEAKKKRPDEIIGDEVSPVHTYLHSECNSCVIGGSVYRGTQFPELNGKYIFGDNGSNRVWSLKRSNLGEVKRELLFQMPYGRRAGLVSFGEDQSGELYPVIHGGGEGSAAILKLDYSEEVTSSFPEKLSETGLFTNLADMTAADGVIPYAVNVPFWSDGATKQRWIVLPGDGTSKNPAVDRIGGVNGISEEWTFPVGTYFVKHFELQNQTTDRRKKVETRVLLLTEEGISGITYRWNRDQTDAIRVDQRKTVSLKTDEGSSKQDWTLPGPYDCMMCHNQDSGFVLGVNSRQINTEYFDLNLDKEANVLHAWQEREMFANKKQNLAETDSVPSDTSENHSRNKQQKRGAVRSLKDTARLEPWHNDRATLQTRVRSYLDVNCSPCHRPGGRPPQNFDFRFTTPFEYQGLHFSQQSENNLKLKKMIDPGNAEESELWKRVSSTAPEWRMPSIGSHKVDPVAAKFIKQWIDSLPADPVE